MINTVKQKKFADEFDGELVITKQIPSGNLLLSVFEKDFCTCGKQKVFIYSSKFFLKKKDIKHLIRFLEDKK